MDKLVLLIPVLPLLGFLLNGLLRNKLPKGVTSVIGSGVILGSFILSLVVFFRLDEIMGGSHAAGTNFRILTPPVFEYFTFIKAFSLNIPFAFQIDQLTSVFLLIITGIGFLIHLYSTAYMHEESSAHFARYFAYLNLFVFSMLLLVMGSNFLVMFIGWEGVGLCSYLLIGYWYKTVEYTKAAQKAFVMNRIGDLGFLLAMLWLISKTGSLNFTDIFSSYGLDKLNTTDLVGISLLLFLGATGKSAQIPLYTWLPDAMAGPTPVSALIHAATMVTAGIYMIARGNALFSAAGPMVMNIIAAIGAATALLAATIALKQNDIKKVLAYSTVSQLGYMFLALGTGAYTVAVFHVMTHAFFKALLFLGSGSVIHAMSGEQDIRKMGGLKKALPVTYITFLIGCLAIAGIIPFSGFFSKDAILLNAFVNNKLLYGIGLLTAALTAFYMFRLFYLTFHGQFRGTEEQKHHLHESPVAMTLPLIVLAILSLIGGFVGIPEVMMHGGEKLVSFLSPVIPVHELEVSHSTEWMLMGIATLVSVGAIIFAYVRYREYREERNGAFGNFLENKWYVDELYEGIIVKPLNALGRFSNRVLERSVIDGFVNGVGKMVNYGGRQLRWLQSGQVGSYVLLMVVSMLVFFVIQFFVRK